MSNSALFFTGLPGAGKTSHAVDALLSREECKGRPVFHHGIHWTPGNDPGVRVYCDHPACMVCPDDPRKGSGLRATDWHQWAEPNSILLFDEVHYIWPKRDNKKSAPEGVEAITQIRHRKIVLIMLTPHPMFVDVDVRRLVTEHWHFRESALGHSVKCWDHCEDDPLSAVGGDVEPKKIPKSTFDKYVSSEMGHAKSSRRMPKKFAFMALFLVVIGVWIVVDAVPLLSRGSALIGTAKDPVITQEAEASSPLPSSASVVVADADAGRRGGFGGSTTTPNLTRVDYENLLNSVPVLPGYPETAPMYSHLVEDLRPTELPRLAGCVKMAAKERCDCYDQAGKKYPTTLQRCEAFFAGRDRGVVPRMDVTEQ